jgi:hypothetical protein
MPRAAIRLLPKEDSINVILTDVPYSLLRIAGVFCLLVFVLLLFKKGNTRIEKTNLLLTSRNGMPPPSPGSAFSCKWFTQAPGSWHDLL